MLFIFLLNKNKKIKKNIYIMITNNKYENTFYI